MYGWGFKKYVLTRVETYLANAQVTFFITGFSAKWQNNFLKLYTYTFSHEGALPTWPNGYSARQLKLLANPLALGRVRIQEASKNRQQFFL